LIRYGSFLLVLLLSAFPTFAQHPPSGPGDLTIHGVVVPPSTLEPEAGFSALAAPEGFDTAAMTVVSVSGLAFFPADSTIPWSWAEGRFVPGSAAFLQAGLQLPHGALVQAIELEACDTSDSGYVRLNFFRCTLPSGGCQVVASLETGGAEMPGCGTFFLALPTPHIVDTVKSSYFFDTRTTSGTADTKIRAARLGYRTPGRVARPRP
jgi:hypothetical protein